ncbi:MAG: TVP38/TMEM64 family protein [Patescibacteria group bacterium]|nr:TVP38/TMEM64 family protein [Patescibacteria group bacterium]
MSQSRIMASNPLYKQIASLLALAAIFLFVSYFAQRYHSELALIVTRGGVFGIVGFIMLTAVFVVFVIPLDIAFLIPIGAAVFGPLPTALMSIAGWTLGAAAAFGIARYFGKPVVERLIGLERVRAVEQRIPKRNLFWSVVVLRMLVSVDILSYALGLVSSMSWGSYVAATAIGVMPFGFFFAYTGTLPLLYRVCAIFGAVLLATFFLLKYGVRREP